MYCTLALKTRMFARKLLLTGLLMPILSSLVFCQTVLEKSTFTTVSTTTDVLTTGNQFPDVTSTTNIATEKEETTIADEVTTDTAQTSKSTSAAEATSSLAETTSAWMKSTGRSTVVPTMSQTSLSGETTQAFTAGPATTILTSQAASSSAESLTTSGATIPIQTPLNDLTTSKYETTSASETTETIDITTEETTIVQDTTLVFMETTTSTENTTKITPSVMSITTATRTKTLESTTEELATAIQTSVALSSASITNATPSAQTTISNINTVTTSSGSAASLSVQTTDLQATTILIGDSATTVENATFGGTQQSQTGTTEPTAPVASTFPSETTETFVSTVKETTQATTTFNIATTIPTNNATFVTTLPTQTIPREITTQTAPTARKTESVAITTTSTETATVNASTLTQTTPTEVATQLPLMTSTYTSEKTTVQPVPMLTTTTAVSTESATVGSTPRNQTNVTELGTSTQTTELMETTQLMVKNITNQTTAAIVTEKTTGGHATIISLKATSTAIGTTTKATTPTIKATETSTTTEPPRKATCPYEALLFAGNILTFLETSVGSSAKSLESCSLTEQDGPALAFRLCVGNTSLAEWQEPVLNNCTSDVNDQLDSLKNKTVTKDNVEKVAELLISLTENISSIDEAALSSTADVLDNIINIRDSSPEVTSDVVNVVNNLLQADQKDSGEPADDSSSRIIQALDSQISHVLANGANFSEVTSSLAVKALSASPSSVAGGVGLVCMKGTTGEDPLTEGRVSVYYSESAIPMDKVEASISLPGEVLMNFVSEGGAVPISFILYQNTKLFRSKKIAKAMEDASRNLSIASSVISATVINSTIDDLPSKTPVSSTFAPHNWQKQINQKSDKIKESLSCVFWDFRLEDGIGDWSTAGCKQARSGDGRTACHCNHATSFAVLVDIHGQYSSLALDLISKIGCGVSIVSLVVTIVVYLAVKKFRKKTASHILIWFCLSLLCLYAVFLFGIEQTSSRVVCIVMAVLMHYFALTSVFWMGVEATNLYLKLIRVFRADVKHFMIKAFIVAWGLPMIVVGVILGVDYTVYENTTSCFLKPGNAFYYGQLLIIGLVLLFNVTIFVLVIRQLTCKADKSVCFTVRSRRSKVARRLQNMVSISILLGLTWIFGLFSVVESTNFIFQILFCAFNSLQGLFIFLLFVVRQGYLTRRRNEYRLDISTSKRKFQLEVPENALSIPDVEGNNETTVTEELGMSLISETVEEEGGFSRGTVTSFTNGGVTDEVEGEGSGEGAKTVRKEDRVSDDAVMSTTSPKEGDNDTTEGRGIKESAPLITL